MLTGSIFRGIMMSVFIRMMISFYTTDAWLSRLSAEVSDTDLSLHIVPDLMCQASVLAAANRPEGREIGLRQIVCIDQ
jgi:hypothetical protein